MHRDRPLLPRLSAFTPRLTCCAQVISGTLLVRQVDTDREVVSSAGFLHDSL